MIKLWSINKWLRWIGFRLVVESSLGDTEWSPTRIGLCWFGLPGSRGWKRIEGVHTEVRVEL